MNKVLKEADTEEVSLRPLSLRPGGAKSPFAGFAKGAGAAFRDKPKEDIFAPPEEEKRKPRGEVVKYTADFLHSLSELCTKVPEELKSFPTILLDTANGRPEQTPVPQAPEPADDRDWRARHAGAPTGEAAARPAGALAAESAGAKQNAHAQPERPSVPQQQERRQVASSQQPAGGHTSTSAPQASATLPAIQTAEELGRKAWQPNATLTADEKAVRAVKGVLNKLTPEKFDVLLDQIKHQISNASILHSSIALVFENAVAQPTFVRMYADLCDRLSKDLPELQGTTNTARTFQRELLNTCQEEFEGAAAAREALKQQPAEELEAAQRRVKQRTLGNIRLIAELFNKGIVFEKIVHACVRDLLGDPKAAPSEDNAEALCELLTISGKNFEAQTKEKKRLETYFSTLEKWQRSPALQPRIRFLIRDVVELRRSQWVPRRETLQAKKLTEIHAEAHAELGMVPASMMANLRALPALQAALPGLKDEDPELFPAFKHSDEGWEMIKQRKEGSALLGEFVTIPVPKAAEPAVEAAIRGQPLPSNGAAAAPEPSQPATSAANAQRKPAKKLDEDGRKAAIKSMLEEFIASNDTAEAITCVQEISDGGTGPALMRQCIDFLFDLTRTREQDMLAHLLALFVQREAVSKHDFVVALEKFMEQLEDLSLDIPKAPKLLGQVVGQAIAGSALALGTLQELCSKCEAAEPRREVAAAALTQVKDKMGEAQLTEACNKADLHADAFLAATSEFDPADLPSVSVYLASQGLSAVPL